jgi:quercetin dioxygenase-like cupin family protein
VLDGCLTYYSAGRLMAAVPGSYVYLPRGLAHGFRVDGDTPARILCV